MLKIGITRCLLYYPMFPFWKSFFESLGYEVVVSNPLKNSTFSGSGRKHVGDICMPIETSFTHADELARRVDWLFVPRINRLHRDIYVCPACAGLPDLFRNVLKLENVLSFNLSPFTKFDRADLDTLRSLAVSKQAAEQAYVNACQAHHEFIAFAADKPVLENAISAYTKQKNKSEKTSGKTGPRLLVLGMPYVLGDEFISKGIVRSLEAQGCDVVTPLMVAPEYIHKEYRLEGYCMYWTTGGMSIAALMKMNSDTYHIDGVIYCSSFACGVDASIAPIAQSLCRRIYDLPYLYLVFDEHAENAHIELRIEAFLDSIVQPNYSPSLDASDRGLCNNDRKTTDEDS